MRSILPLLLSLACQPASDPQPLPAPAPAPVAAPVWPGLDAERASKLVALSLDCVDRPWPNKPSHVYDGLESFVPHTEATPAFSGCFDWHSAVHGHWSMVRVLRLYPELPEASALREALDRHLTPELLLREEAFFAQEWTRGFERPYGWGWYLRLHGELSDWDDPDAQRWARATLPLAALIAGQMRIYLSRLSVPVREGTHSNTAYAMVHALDAAERTGDAELAAIVRGRARDFYGRDRDCPTAYEPSGEDFISPCLVEADLMRRVLPPDEYLPWLGAFLPGPGDARFEPMVNPVEVLDPEDPRIGHLIGLAFQRASCYRGIAEALPDDHPRTAVYRALATTHVQAGWDQMYDSGYGGAHWLASFALYALTDAGPYGAE